MRYLGNGRGLRGVWFRLRGFWWFGDGIARGASLAIGFDGEAAFFAAPCELRGEFEDDFRRRWFAVDFREFCGVRGGFGGLVEKNGLESSGD